MIVRKITSPFQSTMALLARSLAPHRQNERRKFPRNNRYFSGVVSILPSLSISLSIPPPPLSFSSTAGTAGRRVSQAHTERLGAGRMPPGAEREFPGNFQPHNSGPRERAAAEGFENFSGHAAEREERVGREEENRFRPAFNSRRFVFYRHLARRFIVLLFYCSRPLPRFPLSTYA